MLQELNNKNLSDKMPLEDKRQCVPAPTAPAHEVKEAKPQDNGTAAAQQQKG